MACVAGGRETRGGMCRVGRALVVRHVAGGAHPAGQGVISIHMALRALQRSVRAGQREARCRMVKGRICPGNRVVACLASLRKIGLHVVWIRRALEVFEVARHAGCAGQVVVSIHVALGAGRSGVRASQREAGGGMIECCAAP